MKLEDAKKHVQDWLFNAPVRMTINEEWNEAHITDAAQMLMEAHCKIEQLEIANKSLTEKQGDGYSNITRTIEQVPQTWLPGLLATVAMECIKKQVFQKDVSKAVASMERTWRAENYTYRELQEGLERTAGK